MSQEVERGVRTSAHEFRGRMSQIIHDRVSGDVGKAAALERIICRQSMIASLQEQNADPSLAVDEGLKQIMLALMNRRQRRERQNREQTLRVVLGHRFNAVMNLVREIGIARLGHASVGCSNGVCLRNKALIERPVLPRIARRMPSPVLRLFFRNQLCQAVEQCPLSRLAEQDWDAMFEEAKRDLNKYLMWSSLGTKQERNFTVQCSEKRIRDDTEDQNMADPRVVHPSKKPPVSKESICRQAPSNFATGDKVDITK